jgi:hypothetical protein
MQTRTALILLLAGLVSACHLIDRGTFAPESQLPQPTQLPTAALPERRAPLVTIRYETANPPYEGALAEAIRTAESRTANLEYDVVAVVPQNGGPKAEAADMAQGRDDEGAVMRTIMDQGVPDNRIRLSERIDPKASAREVRVYVR